MNRWLTLGLLAVSLCIVACDEQKAAPDSSGGQATAAAQIKDEDIPTPADFDDDAEKTINETNYKAEVDALEKEISAE